MPVRFRIGQTSRPFGTADQSRHDLVANEPIMLEAVEPAPATGVLYQWEIIDRAASAATLSAPIGTSVTIAATPQAPFAFLVELRAYVDGQFLGAVRRLCGARTPVRKLRLPMFSETADPAARLAVPNFETCTDNAQYTDRAGQGPGQNWRGWIELLHELTLAMENVQDVQTQGEIGNATMLRDRLIAQIVPTAGQHLTFDGNAWTPTTVTIPQTPALTAGGDAIGTLADLRVAGIRGRSVFDWEPQSGQVLAWMGTGWGPMTVQTPGTIGVDGDARGELGQIRVVGLQGRALTEETPLVGEHLTFDGNNWTPAPLTSTTPTNGQVLTWQGASSVWTPTTLPAAPTAGSLSAGGDATGKLSALTVTKLQGRAVDSTAPAVGQVLTWTDFPSPGWAPTDLPTGTGGGGGTLEGGDASMLQGSPVAGTAPSTGEALIWTGVAWTPSPVALAGAFVDPTPPADGQVLTYVDDGSTTQWVARAPEGGLGPTKSTGWASRVDVNFSMLLEDGTFWAGHPWQKLGLPIADSTTTYCDVFASQQLGLVMGYAGPTDPTAPVWTPWDDNTALRLSLPLDQLGGDLTLENFTLRISGQFTLNDVEPTRLAPYTVLFGVETEPAGPLGRALWAFEIKANAGSTEVRPRVQFGDDVTVMPPEAITSDRIFELEFRGLSEVVFRSKWGSTSHDMPNDDEFVREQWNDFHTWTNPGEGIAQVTALSDLRFVLSVEGAPTPEEGAFDVIDLRRLRIEHVGEVLVYPDIHATHLGDFPIDVANVEAGQRLEFNGTAWAPSSVGGGNDAQSLQGVPISNLYPSGQDQLIFDGSEWRPRGGCYFNEVQSVSTSYAQEGDVLTYRAYGDYGVWQPLAPDNTIGGYAKNFDPNQIRLNQTLTLVKHSESGSFFWRPMPLPITQWGKTFDEDLRTHLSLSPVTDGLLDTWYVHGAGTAEFIENTGLALHASANPSAFDGVTTPPFSLEHEVFAQPAMHQLAILTIEGASRTWDDGDFTGLHLGWFSGARAFAPGFSAAQVLVQLGKAAGAPVLRVVVGTVETVLDTSAVPGMGPVQMTLAVLKRGPEVFVYAGPGTLLLPGAFDPYGEGLAPGPQLAPSQVLREVRKLPLVYVGGLAPTARTLWPGTQLRMGVHAVHTTGGKMMNVTFSRAGLYEVEPHTADDLDTQTWFMQP